MVRNEIRPCQETKFSPSSVTGPQKDGTDIAQHLWAKVSSIEHGKSACSGGVLNPSGS